jgi:hypothetical protein
MSFDFHVEVVIGSGESAYAATADYAATAAKPNQAVTAQRVNVDPKCALDRWPPAISSTERGRDRARRIGLRSHRGQAESGRDDGVCQR